MSEINIEAIYFIEKNSKEVYCNGIQILLRLLNNIINEPDNSKYRKFKLNNKIIEQKLLPVDGMKELLLSIGFELSNNEFTLPPNVLIKKIRKYKDFIEERLKAILSGETKKTAEATSFSHLEEATIEKKEITKTEKTILTIQPTKSYLERISFPLVLRTTNRFLKNIEGSSDHVMQYEDENLLNIGRHIIPLDILTNKSIKNMREIQKAIRSGKYKEPEPCLRDLLLAELANWFHDEFFEWVNNVRCKKCDNEIHNYKIVVENGIQVEMGWCCNVESRFYRYNDITDLLRTRQGRCGEYANCFTFFCRCLNYDTRHVVATFDHVWTEVYSFAQKRWIHIDPSDNVLDAPLMYQHGWKRKIDYVLAYSRDDIQDVTWRYTNNHKDILKLRRNCREDELLEAIMLLRKKRQINLSDARIKFLNKRYLNELVELTKQREPTENERKGRSSGSLSWRQERGEQHLNNFYIFTLLPLEVEHKNFNLRFSCVKNIYERFVKINNIDNIINSFKDFDSTTFTVKNIFRKIEKDWKMTYLARNENCASGEIIWKFDFQSANLRIKEYQLKFDTKTFESGNVILLVTDLSGSQKIEEANGLIIKASLQGGNGDTAWQHAQLFRQSLNSNEYPFVLNISFY
ncbi:peptide-N(4)-(N-acetyl-beta-glucosaminyl)asparagine amidase [Condylostylus longicornis]|uniref:peptide-N(4)-(N-acetyl-beta- glucosaminyl)asparagine amidase n=1 Tax=Condylostylus longicornis TaxID=2530218 RepID=UPI00244DADD1|nr:peptide-N(4)-(N-acetyl-beta-glucosaminyl)asparagine amidase [Condylostylus longicornis]